jgi:hypothetical protein
VLASQAGCGILNLSRETTNRSKKMSRYVIANLDRPGYYWRSVGARNDNGLALPAGWASELDGSYKVYVTFSRAEYVACKMKRAGLRVDVVMEPASARQLARSA